jgi:hypothetical protein
MVLQGQEREQMPNTFIIVYAESMVRPYFTKSYKFRKTAQNACDKLNARYAKNYGRDHDSFAVYSQDEYAAAVKGKGEWKQSVCGGKVWVELGTPACCDPSTETYWSM